MKVNKRHRLLCVGACVTVGIALAAIPAETAGAGVPPLLGHSQLIQSAQTIEVIVLIVLAGFLILRKLGRPASDLTAGEQKLAGISPAHRREKLSEEEDFDKFVVELRAGPAATATASPPATAGLLSSGPTRPFSHPAEAGPESGLAAWAQEQVEELQKLIEKSRQMETQAAQRDLLVEIYDQIVTLKDRVCRPDLQPAWQLASAMEGLLKQITGRADNINHSTLRTIAGGLQLLGDLCKSGVRADLSANPAIKILAADDDSVTRFALNAAVKKAFDQPDLAENGKEVLARVRQHHYDLIILDVMMPDMDGFEICGKIRETATNGSTPVLFVTSLKDFEARARSLSSGGSDLMGKPFLTFEIAVKALTLVLRARLRDRNRIGEAPGGGAASGLPAVHWPESRPAPESEEHSDPPVELLKGLNRSAGDAGANSSALLPPSPFVEAVAAGQDLRESPPNDPLKFSPAFLTFMAAFLREMKHDLTVIGGLEESAARQEMLVRLHMRLQSLSRKINLPELRPAYQMCCAVEGLCKKLRIDSKKVTPSALRTAATGLELLGDLCAPGVRPDLAENPPIRILVVDDEPLARRALLGAMQMAFPRPDGAESAESALAIAREMEFDLVFLDVCMPEMNGFTACTRIHETALNRTTPVVFVTSHSDAEFRAEADLRGARDFVVKPFDFMEIPVKALTYALQARLEKLKAKPSSDAPAPAPTK